LAFNSLACPSAGSRRPLSASRLPLTQRQTSPLSGPRLHLTQRSSPWLRHSDVLLELRGGDDAKFDPSKLLATVIGWSLSSAAFLIYTPMIISTLRARSAIGMSAATWSLQLSGFLIFVIYHVRNELPLSTYMDFAALAIQAAVLLAMICIFQSRLYAVAVLPPISLAAACLLPKQGLQRLQAVSTFLTSAAPLPQILQNFASLSRGGWSPISAGLSTVGNTMRVYTTLKLADGNRLLLVQFGVNAFMNGVLLLQSLLWP